VFQCLFQVLFSFSDVLGMPLGDGEDEPGIGVVRPVGEHLLKKLDCLLRFSLRRLA
jgi:hypothetical protein